MSATAQALLLARRALVQFPRNPVLLGFSLMPVLIMYLVFGGLFQGVSELPGFPTDNYFEYLAPTAILLATVPGIGNAGVALAADLQSGYFHKLLTTPTSVGTIILGRLLGDCLRLAVQAALVLVLAVALGAQVESGLPGAVLMIAMGTLLGIVTFGALSANLAIRTRDAAAVQAIQPMAFLLIFLTSAYQTTDHIDSGVLRTIIELNPAEHVLRRMRELMLTGYNWGDIGTGLLVIAGLGLLVLPLTARNYRSVYG
jgi:ABC-2 type transport system permease protein